MRGRPNLFRDVFFLTLPVMGLSLYFLVSALVSWWNAEIVNYSGYPTRNIRVANLREMITRSTDPLLQAGKRDWLSDRRRTEPTVPVVDLRVRGNDLDQLDSALPASAKTWVPAQLVVDRVWQEVEARHRGQRMENFFWHRRSWKIKTDRLELVDGYRDLNLSPIEGRLDNHMSNVVGARLGIPTPRSRLVHMFVNKEDMGLYLQEEQVDESLMRRSGHMPGDVFYGDLFVPDEPKLGTDEVFCNPFLWEKKSRNNRYDDEYRPHLTLLLDLIASPELESWDRLWELCDREQFVRFMALVSYQGDQHGDKSHNHKLFFNPLAGTFEAVPWNVRMNMPRGHGVESIANRLYEKLARDPRFLDDVHRVVHDELLAGGERDVEADQLAALDEMHEVGAGHALDLPGFEQTLALMRRTVEARARTVRRHHGAADLRHELEGERLRLWCKSVASLRLQALVFESELPESVLLVEDRDGDGRVGPGDRTVRAEARGERLVISDPEAILAPGRDFSAPYHQVANEGQDAFAAHRLFTRLAFLSSDFLLRAEDGSALPALAQVVALRTVGEGKVHSNEGAPPPGQLSADGSIHPWSFPAPDPGRVVSFEGETSIMEDLLLRPQDRLEIEPGTTLRLGPGVSIVVRSTVDLNRVTIRRLDPAMPWGCFAVQGPGADGSRIVDCDFEGGSHDMLDFVDYTGMLSVFEVDDVVLRGGRYAANLLGDDTVRFARCERLLIDSVRVERANGDAIDCDISTGRIVGVDVDRPHNDGIDLMTAVVDLDRITIVGAGDKGVSLGESANPVVSGLRIRDCVTGIAIKDASDPIIEDCWIEGCDTAIGGYDKNWRYPGGGRGKLVRCTLKDNAVDIKLDARSFLILEDMALPPTVSVPGALEQSLELRVTAPESKP